MTVGREVHDGEPAESEGHAGAFVRPHPAVIRPPMSDGADHAAGVIRQRVVREGVRGQQAGKSAHG